MVAEPLLSIVIPTYNCAPWLERAIASAHACAPQPFEIVVVDDGSTDGTPALRDPLLARYPELVWLRQPNRGLSAARNAGIARARGTWLALLDADDEFVALDWDEVIAHGADALRVGVDEVTEDGMARSRDETFDPCTGAAYLQQRLSAQAFYPPSWAWLYRTAFLRTAKLRFVTGLQHEDMLFTVQALLAAERVAALPGARYLYHRRTGSLSLGVSPAQARRRIHSLGRIVDALVHIANDAPEVDIGGWALFVIDYARSIALQSPGRRNRLRVAAMTLRFFRHYRWGRYRTFRDERWRLRATAGLLRPRLRGPGAGGQRGAAGG
jgi:hypothetical protein